jgi:hypothetical protein
VLEKKADAILKKYAGRKIWKVKSFSRENEAHIVWQKDDGSWNCTCEAKSFHPSWTCDHIRSVRHQKMKLHGRNKKKKVL